MSTHELGVFEGKTEVASELKVTKTGDGLSKPLAAEPRAWESGTRIPVLMWVEVGQITHAPVDKGPGFVRVHTAPVVEAAVLDRVPLGTLDELMKEQREQVRAWEIEQKRLRDEAAGVLRLDVDPPKNGSPPADGDGAVSDADWETDARNAPPTAIGAKRAKKT